MTETLIVSQPRMRFFKWIGGGVYKPYGVGLPRGVSESAGGIGANWTGTPYEREIINVSGVSRRAQQFYTTLSNRRLQSVSVWLRRYGSPTGTLNVRLLSDNNNVPGSTLTTIASIDVSTLPTTMTKFTYTISPYSLTPNTRYWISLEYLSGDANNHVRTVQFGSDVEPNFLSAYYSGSWVTQSAEYRMELGFVFSSFTTTHTFNVDYQYSGPAVRRLEDIGTKTNATVNSITVNNQDVGASLERSDSIPQSSSYTITYNYTVANNVTSYDLGITIQRYLYYDKQSITLDDLAVSEAYIQKVTFGQNGSVLRIDGSPDSDLVGNADQSIIFPDVIVPFRRLEWLQGGGEVEILGVE